MKRFEPTFFEKLFDDSPSEPARRRLSLDELKDSVARDLEALLNARSTLDEARSEEYPLAANSSLSYGLRDFAAMNLSNPDHRREICRSIERTVSCHEKRLKDIKVEIELGRRSVNALHFSIRGVLMVHPAQERVNFDALLQPTTLQYAVSRDPLRRIT